MGKLRDQMFLDLQLNGAKPSTQRAYLREAANLAKYFNRSPEPLGDDELKAYLLHLMKERHLSEGTFRFYVAGLKCLYRTTLKREWAVEKIRYPRAKRKLPVVLDLSEVQSLFSVTKNLKHKAILMITDSSGLRVSETARLKLTDIDSKRMMVRVSQGKGGKDRYSILSQTALEQLRQAIGISATTAVMWRYRITPAGIVTAPNARPCGKRNGSRRAVTTSCPFPISMWSSPSPRNSTPWYP